MSTSLLKLSLAFNYVGLLVILPHFFAFSQTGCPMILRGEFRDFLHPIPLTISPNESNQNSTVKHNINISLFYL